MKPVKIKPISDHFVISVVIPAYNSRAYIGRAVESVFGQSRPCDELIIVDDGSDDDTGEVVGKLYSKTPLRFI